MNLSGADAASEQRKRELFLRAREDMGSMTAPTPKPSATPAVAPRHTPEPAKQVPPKAIEATPEVKPTSIKRAQPVTPTPAKKDEMLKPPVVKETLPNKVSSKPESTPLKAPVKIQKSGLQKEEGLVPVKKKRRSSIFGSRYKYLTSSVRRELDNAKVRKGRWKYIIVHNSGTRQGNAKAFHIYHLRTRKMPNGLAYHFVIGNGHGSGDGEIEVGNRWRGQINGGHVASDYLNNISLGICLVGDLNRDKPTPAQLAALDELIRYLRTRVGKHKGKPPIVKGHREINPRPTDCPGDRFPLRWLHQKFD